MNLQDPSQQAFLFFLIFFGVPMGIWAIISLLKLVIKYLIKKYE